MELASKYCFVPDVDEEDLFDDGTLNDEKNRVRKEKKKKKNKKSDEDDFLALSDDEESYKYDELPDNRIRKIRKADPNILAVNLGTLSEDVLNLFTGDPVFCSQCKAVLTEISKLENNYVGQAWTCEYCGHLNQTNLDPEEIPKGDTIDYVLSASSSKSELTDIVVFCIDVSGSMCCTSEVTGDFKIKLDQKLAQNLDEFIERAHGVAAQQYLPRERTDISYVSRLQCVQAAVSSQIEKLAKEHPKKRVAIVTFSNDVTVYLPGGTRHIITGDKLNQYDYLVNVGSQYNINIDKYIEETHKELTDIVIGLEENGATALGPALMTSISIAGSTRGSTVVLCTDGIANIGLGSLENYNGDDPNSPAALFYQQASNEALQKGVSVSIVSIKGTNASLEYIAKVSTDTRGYNHIVDPLSLTKNFNFILQNSIIATEVTATMFLNRGLTFRHEKNAQDTKATRVVGNCTKESSITFEYYPAEKNILKDAKQVCFQIQINFTKLDGTKCLRVISKNAEITTKREEAEKNVNVKVVGLHSQAQAAQLASEGKYTKARMVQKTNMRMVRRTIAQDPTESQSHQYDLWNQEALRLNSAIKSTKIAEKNEGLLYDSAEEDLSEDEMEKEMEKKMEKETKECKEELVKKKKEKEDKKKKIEIERKKRRAKNDIVSNVIYQGQNPLYSAYSEHSNPLYDE